MSYRSVLYVLLSVVALSACSMNTNITSDSRFINIIGIPIRTKTPLRLYAIDYQRSGNRDRCDFTETEYVGDELIGVVPAGHPVRFDKVFRRNEAGGSWERMEGEITFCGKIYPIAYDLGPIGYGDACWHRVFKSFDIKEGQPNADSMRSSPS